MTLPLNKTKIVCTLGPASESPEVLERMIQAGMNVARLNFSHGDFDSHRTAIERVRAAARKLEKRVTIMADMPGPKIRIGKISPEPIELTSGSSLTLTTEEIIGTSERISVNFPGLSTAVKPGNTLFLNDGFIQLEVLKVVGKEISCRVVVGGELRSRKGLNFPGIDLGIRAFTEKDQRFLKFALEQGVDAVSQSFVENAADIVAVRKAAESMGHHPFIIGKIERSRALDNMENILEAVDGIMIARGDLGVEIPIEQIAVVQKRLTRQANLMGKPVITATQMLESMTANSRPTRAEATDVANAILDGTDCVMLSEESAAGKFPVEAVGMLAKIAAAIEPQRPAHHAREILETSGISGPASVHELIALSVATISERVSPAAVFVPTRGGATARSISRFRLPVWVTAVTSQEGTCQNLQFSYGVYPVFEGDRPDDWRAYARDWLSAHGLSGHIVIVTEGPSPKHPEVNNRVEIIDLARHEGK